MHVESVQHHVMQQPVYSHAVLRQGAYSGDNALSDAEGIPPQGVASN